jgi:hypothetical protein
VDPPKFIVITNHALNGEGNSFDRRQYAISFSDYYNSHRTVGDQFGHQLFHEWDYNQWNLFYNWMAECIQLYLRHGLTYVIPGEAIERRKIRQQIGESFLNWASLMYDREIDHSGEPAGVFLNKKIEKGFLLSRYLDIYPKERRYVDATKLKDKLIKYARYAGLSFNPIRNGGRIKSNGQEFFILADDRFEASMAGKAIKSDEDLRNYNSPFNP